MLLSRAWEYFAQSSAVVQGLVTGVQEQKALSGSPVPIAFAFSKTWSVLGPFQIGTRGT